MRQFAEKFYASAKWHKMRDYVRSRDLGICVKCGKAGDVVHHIIPITPENINDPFITLCEDNLITLCTDCHAAAHSTPRCADGLSFDENGDIIRTETPDISV